MMLPLHTLPMRAAGVFNAAAKLGMCHQHVVRDMGSQPAGEQGWCGMRSNNPTVNQALYRHSTILTDAHHGIQYAVLPPPSRLSSCRTVRSSSFIRGGSPIATLGRSISQTLHAHSSGLEWNWWLIIVVMTTCKK